MWKKGFNTILPLPSSLTHSLFSVAITKIQAWRSDLSAPGTAIVTCSHATSQGTTVFGENQEMPLAHHHFPLTGVDSTVQVFISHVPESSAQTLSWEIQSCFDKHLLTALQRLTQNSVCAVSQEQHNQDTQEVGFSPFQETGQGDSGQWGHVLPGFACNCPTCSSAIHSLACGEFL